MYMFSQIYLIFVYFFHTVFFVYLFTVSIYLISGDFSTVFISNQNNIVVGAFKMNDKNHQDYG